MRNILVLISWLALSACSHWGGHGDHHADHHADGKKCEHHDHKDGKSCPMHKGVYFPTLKDGDTVAQKIKVAFGVNGMEVKPAGDATPLSGHHHLIIDGKPLAKGQVVPKDEKNIHFGKAQTEGEITLTPGEHTLTLQFADANHLSFGDEWSKTIKVNVK